jgi:glycylpeptide N-tetradecanoyltransferase
MSSSAEKTVDTATSAAGDVVEEATGAAGTTAVAQPAAPSTNKKRKGKKKGKKAPAEAAAAKERTPADIAREAGAIRQLQQILATQAPASAAPKEHRFWATQPVPHEDKAGTGGGGAADTAAGEEEADDSSADGPIDKIKTVEEVKAEPYSLPGGFEWDTIDVEEEAQLVELYTLLNENYVEDDDNMFRFDYPAAFLRWALCPPGFYKDWHVGVRVSKTRKLVGFISGIPVRTHVRDSDMMMCEINFLCVHKKLRSKRLAPVLIKEVTRRVNLLDIWQAIYTAGVTIPTPVASCRYYHRTLNAIKLLETGFTYKRASITKNAFKRMYKLPDAPQLPNSRPMTPADVPAVTALFRERMFGQEQYKVWLAMDESEVAHWFLPRASVVNTVVWEQDGKVVAFSSYYHLGSTVIDNPKHDRLNAVYSFYYAPGPFSCTDVMRDTLIIAKQDDADVFNCLDLMHNSEFLDTLKFGKGDGTLQYYLYNWRTASMSNGEVGVVLL